MHYELCFYSVIRQHETIHSAITSKSKKLFSRAQNYSNFESWIPTSEELRLPPVFWFQPKERYSSYCRELVITLIHSSFADHRAIGNFPHFWTRPWLSSTTINKIRKKLHVTSLFKYRNLEPLISNIPLYPERVKPHIDISMEFFFYHQILIL